MIKIDQIIRTKRRSMALIIKPDGTLVVRAPLRTPDLIIRAFVESKASWINTHQAAVAANPTRQSTAYADGQSLWYLGHSYRLTVVETAVSPLSFHKGWFLSKKALPHARTLLTNWFRAQALRIISERVKIIAAKNGFTYQAVKITSAQTRWGSCSAKNNLNFPWRLVMAPLEIIDYVVVHELVHTVVKNHGSGFWNKVKAITPDYVQKRKWLFENGKNYKLN